MSEESQTSTKPGSETSLAPATGDAPLILIVEDEAPIRRLLHAPLIAANYRLSEADTGRDGLRLAALRPPDMVLLDLGLPDMDGQAVLRELREWLAVPVIVLSDCHRERIKVAVLDQGADDYVTKPFGIGELLARIRVALRRDRVRTGPTAATFRIGDLRVDFGARRIFVRDREVHLTRIEYRLLTTLVNHAGKVLTHAFLLEKVWGPLQVHKSHYLRVAVATLRRKIEPDSNHPRYLLTELGVGYRVADE